MDRIRLNLDSIAMMLFCAQLKLFKETPLSNEEWLMIENIIQKKGIDGPSSLFSMSQDELIVMLEIDELVAYKMSNRLKKLNVFLNILNNLEKKGINITTKYEDDFPGRLVIYLRKRAPLYLFYCGDITIIEDGVSMVGLTKVTKKDRTYTKKLVDKAINDNLIYISNDSKGVDEIALYHALRHGCHCIDFVCEGLKARQSEFTKYIENHQMLLLCAEDPDSCFNITSAIDRNSYVCALSKYQIVVSSNINSGATWFTVLQNLHNNWTIPMTVDELYLGNVRLLDMGVTPIRIGDIISSSSFDLIYEKNKKVDEIDRVNIDQMSIFEFIGE